MEILLGGHELPPALAGGSKVISWMGFSPNLNFGNGAKAQKLMLPASTS
jgi:hypothetical protein